MTWYGLLTRHRIPIRLVFEDSLRMMLIEQFGATRVEEWEADGADAELWTAFERALKIRMMELELHRQEYREALARVRHVRNVQRAARADPPRAQAAIPDELPCDRC